MVLCCVYGPYEPPNVLELMVESALNDGRIVLPACDSTISWSSRLSICRQVPSRRSDSDRSGVPITNTITISIMLVIIDATTLLKCDHILIWVFLCTIYREVTDIVRIRRNIWKVFTSKCKRIASRGSNIYWLDFRHSKTH